LIYTGAISSLDAGWVIAHDEGRRSGVAVEPPVNQVRATNQESISSRGWAFARASLLVVWLISAFATTAHADALAPPTDPVARKHQVTGNRYYRLLRDFEKAIEEYQAGALKEDAPVFSYNLGQCYRRLGRYEEAIWHYERFLDRGKPTGEVEASVKKFIAQMKDELAKKAMTKPPAEPAPPPASNPPDRSALVSADATQIVVARSPWWYEDTFGWGMTGAGAVAVGASGLMFLSASRLINQANSEPNQQAQGELHDKADTRRLLGTVITVGGAALIATGVLKLAINDGERSPRATLGIGKSGLALFGRF
jgi:tetratricopeptide (TPR) repeat protein